MRDIFCKFYRCRGAFTLAEVTVALVVGTMILVAVLGIYSRAERAAEAITRRLDSTQLPSEIIQRIAEDLDGIIAAGDSAFVTVENKIQNLFPVARLTITKSYYDDSNKKQTFEKIVWQSNYEPEQGSLVLYRSYSGIGVEDKLLDEKREGWESDFSFVPISTGLTFFKIEALAGDQIQDVWRSESLPRGILVTLSFAEPYKTVSGELEVPEHEKIMRTIAVDRTRKISFVLAGQQIDDESEQQEEESQEEGQGEQPSSEEQEQEQENEEQEQENEEPPVRQSGRRRR
jgi:hypothetical protein